MRRLLLLATLLAVVLGSQPTTVHTEDILQFSITANGTVSVTLPRYTVCAKVVNSGDQRVVVADFTGANCGTWPGVLATLTNAQLVYLRDQQLLQILRWKAGLDTNIP